VSVPQTTISELKEVTLYDRLSDSRVRCQICLWRCVINPGKLGVCRMRRNDGGTLYALNYSSVSSVAIDPIEKKPLFHFFPGTRVFSLGTWGCNFHCLHCQNWEISCVEQPGGEGRASQKMSPQDAITLAKQNQCAGIAWTYNEPTMWFEYTLDSAKLAKQNCLGLSLFLAVARLKLGGRGPTHHRRISSWQNGGRRRHRPVSTKAFTGRAQFVFGKELSELGLQGNSFDREFLMAGLPEGSEPIAHVVGSQQLVSRG